LSAADFGASNSVEQAYFLRVGIERDAQAMRRRAGAGAISTRAAHYCTWNFIVPADGTALPPGENGDFGTSPIYEQLSDKPPLALAYSRGVPDAKHN